MIPMFCLDFQGLGGSGDFHVPCLLGMFYGSTIFFSISSYIALREIYCFACDFLHWENEVDNYSQFRSMGRSVYLPLGWYNSSTP
jgi:hypothetical protein